MAAEDDFRSAAVDVSNKERETMLKTMLKRTTLILVSGVLAITLSQSQGSAAFCVIERGLDPLDVLANEVKHNVWIILDRSGSMDNPFDNVSGPRRIDEAQAVINEVLTEFVDAYGEPRVNWGFRQFLCNSRGGSCSSLDFVGTNDPSGSDCPTNTRCGGLLDDDVEPPGCEELSTVTDIQSLMDLTNGGEQWARGLTPNGISLVQLANQIKAGYLDTNSMLPGQRNYIVLLTDGEETCECHQDVNDSNPSPMLRGQTADPTPNVPVTVPPGPDTGDCDNDGNTTELDNTEVAAVRGYNAGLRGEEAFKILHENTAPYDGSQGDIFIVGMGINDQGCHTPQDFQNITNHLAWNASGASLGSPDARAALFATKRDELKEKILDVLSRISLPTTEVTLGSPIVGSVKELIPLADSTVAAADIVASGVNDVQARVLRVEYRNNILLTTSAQTPGFKGHLRAYNIFKVIDPGLPTETREADFTQVWDAGEELQTRNLQSDPRTIYFSADGSSSTLLDFVEAGSGGDLTAAQLGVSAGFLSDYDPLDDGAATAADAAEIVEKTIRGWRLVITASDGFYDPLVPGKLNWSQYENDGVTGTWKLFESTRSAPAIVLNPPRSPDADPPEPVLEYRTFYDDEINRLTTVYLGTNGGMMHAFRADNGYELYGYVPHDLRATASTIPWFRENSIGPSTKMTASPGLGSSSSRRDRRLPSCSTRRARPMPIRRNRSSSIGPFTTTRSIA